MMPVGEFTVDCIGEENMEGFIIRTLSVLHNKVGAACMLELVGQSSSQSIC